MNAGHETGRNTSDLFSYKHASALKVTMMILTHWKICSESPKRRHSCPHEIYWLSLINTSYWYLQNILIHFHCFSNGLSSNNLFCGGSLPNSLLERLIMPAGAVQTQKSFSGHSVSLPAPTCLTLSSSPWVNSDVTVHYWSLSGTSGSEVVDSMNILENKQVGHFFFRITFRGIRHEIQFQDVMALYNLVGQRFDYGFIYYRPYYYYYCY